MDESFDPQPTGTFVVGGLLGRGVAIFELARRWGKLRTRPDIDIAYFKASECANGNGEFAKFIAVTHQATAAERARLDAISHEFLSTIVNPPYDKNYLTLFGVGVVQPDFYDIVKEPNAKAVLGSDPYRLAYDLAMIQCAWAMKELGTGESVSFICDECEQHSATARESYIHLKNTNPNAAVYMATFGMEDEKRIEPLQAADAVVYEIRRALRLSLGQAKGELRKQFGILTSTRALYMIAHTNREQLEWLASNHRAGEPFKLDELMKLQIDENIHLTL